MPQFRVELSQTLYWAETVEAANEEEAMEKARDMASPDDAHGGSELRVDAVEMVDDPSSLLRSNEKSDDKIAPLLAGAGRVAMGAAKNPKVQSAVGNAVGGMIAGKKDPNDPNQANKGHKQAVDTVWHLMKNE
tara:strand:- start:56 stop:454 length:399 start_codon:yes stop_codon:yes gene_type:complete